MTWSNSKGRGTKYGTAHQAERKRRAKTHQPTDPCVRCGHPLGPMGPGLHLDHDEHGGYHGFSHGTPCPWCKRRCNVSAGSSKAAKRRNGVRPTVRARKPPAPRDLLG